MLLSAHSVNGGGYYGERTYRIVCHTNHKKQGCTMLLYKNKYVTEGDNIAALAAIQCLVFLPYNLPVGYVQG